jgi:hypothetical protein
VLLLAVLHAKDIEQPLRPFLVGYHRWGSHVFRDLATGAPLQPSRQGQNHQVVMVLAQTGAGALLIANLLRFATSSRYRLLASLVPADTRKAFLLKGGAIVLLQGPQYIMAPWRPNTWPQDSVRSA